ncbi:MAG TPA: hypothetical protein DG753_04485 [Clostridium sp.]|nr:hypothetical protein [Clostridium sp.]
MLRYNFLGDIINKLLQTGKLKQIGTFYTDTINLPIYETVYNGKTVGINVEIKGTFMMQP